MAGRAPPRLVLALDAGGPARGCPRHTPPLLVLVPAHTARSRFTARSSGASTSAASQAHAESRDAKEILEALQLKGLIHHHATPAPLQAARATPAATHGRHAPVPSRGAACSDAADTRAAASRRRRPRVPPAVRRSPDPAAFPARSSASPAHRGPQSLQGRVSPAQSPKQRHQGFRKPSGFDSAGARSRIARHAAHNAATLSLDDEASTTFSDGCSSSSLSASSRWDFEP